MGGHEPMPSGSVKIEVDGIGLAPLAPAPVSPQPAVSSVSEVQMSTADLFVQYHEYFQKLHLDMQHTSAAIAQRRTRSGSKARVRIDLNTQCFGGIARSIAEKDKPLVIIGEGESVPDASAAGGSEPRMVVRESDLAMIREQLRIAARAESSDASHDMLLSQAVSNHPPVDLEGMLEGMATDELSMFVGGGVELQEAGLDLDQLVSVLASDDPLKLEPDMAADSMGADGFPRSGLEAGGVSLEEAGMAAFLAEANAAPSREDRMPSYMSTAALEEAVEAGGVKMEVPSLARMDSSETASVSTARPSDSDVETASNAGSDAAGSEATSDVAGLEAADGWSTPPVPPSPTLAGAALPPASPACKHVAPLVRARPSGVMMESEAAAGQSTTFKGLGERPKADEVHIFASAGGAVESQEALCAASPSAAFDKAELLELLSKHYPSTPDGPDGEPRDAMSSGKRSLLATDDAAAADDSPTKRLRGGAVRA